VAKQFYFILDVVPCYNKTLKDRKICKSNFISFHDEITPEIKKIGLSTDGGGSGPKFFKIIIF